MTPARRTLSVALPMALAAICLLQDAPAPRAGGNIESAAGANLFNAFWDTRTFPIRWRLGPNNGYDVQPSTVGVQGADFTNVKVPALDPTMNTWENLPDNALDFTYGGTTTDATPGADGFNTIHFNQVFGADPGYVASAPCVTLIAAQIVTDASFAPSNDGKGCLKAGAPCVLPPPGSSAAIAIPIGTYPPGTNIDCDVSMNTFAVQFSTDGTPGTEDIQGIVTHEVGHWHSLSHTPHPDATMFPFTDTLPSGNGVFPGGGSASLEQDDISSTGHVYGTASFDTNNGTITGTVFITNNLGTQRGTGVHVTAHRASDLKPIAGRMSISQFMLAADVVDGADFVANGAGFYRLDGLPPGTYYVCAEYFDATDERFGSRLQNRYNTTVGNSTVADGAAGAFAGTLGFRPERTECHNLLESGNGGNGATPGAAADNPDEATSITLIAGQTVPGVNIHVNLDPDTLKTAAARDNPTGIARHDLGALLSPTLVEIEQDGIDDDYWLVRYPAVSLPAPPYNVMEGIWTKYGRADRPYVGALLLSQPADPNVIEPPIVWDTPRLVAGHNGGQTGISELFEIRDRFNVTVNEARDLWFIIQQPETAVANPDLAELFAAITQNVGIGLASQRTLFTNDDFQTLFVSTTFDMIYRVRTESAPPVMINSATPASVTQGDTGMIIDIGGAGFRSGATVALRTQAIGGEIPSGITVTNTQFISAALLRVTVDVSPFAPVGVLDVEVTNPEVIIPNRSRLMQIQSAPDLDNDGFIGLIDCDDNSNQVWGIPGDIGATVVGTDLGGGVARMIWSPSGSPGGVVDRYRVVRGQGSTLKGSGGTNFGSCFADNLLLNVVDDAAIPPLPPPGGWRGDAYLYMIAEKSACPAPNTGTYGSAARDANLGNCAP